VSFQSPSFSFKPVQETDLPLLRSWLLLPHVAEWWGVAESIDDLRADYVTHADEPNATRAFIAYLGSRAIGFIQAYVVLGSGGGWWEQETDPGARGTDQFLADQALLGKGIGQAMIRTFVAQLFTDPAVTFIQTDPDPSNQRAVRCYARSGFQEVGIVSTPDGPALLMRCTRESLSRAKANAA
jgi:RimJ/RimL family protein N-acetyltransferase